MTSATLVAKVRELKNLEADITRARLQAESIKEDIKKHMGDVEELSAGGYRVRYKPVESSRFDVIEFKVKHRKLYERYMTTATTRRFSVE